MEFKEFEKILDTLLLNATMHNMTKKYLDTAASDFNEAILKVSICDYDMTEEFNNKLERANKVLDELMNIEK